MSLHSDHLLYAERLKEGRSIGSSHMEGDSQILIGSHLKAHPARWRVARVHRMAVLCRVTESAP